MEKVPENSDFSDLINSIIFVLILFCISFFLSHENCKNVTYFANNPGIICTSADTKYQSGIIAWIISRICPAALRPCLTLRHAETILGE